MRFHVSKKILTRLVTCYMIFFLVNPLSFAQELEVIGETLSSGSVEMSTTQGSWEKIESANPIFSDMTYGYRTGNGRLTLILNDGTRLGADKNTSFTIAGRTGQYPVKLEKGLVSFKVSPDTTLTVHTPDAIIEITDAGSGEDVIGAVVFDGESSTVKSIQGNIKIRKINEMSNPIVLSSGESVIIKTKDDDRKKLAAISTEPVIDEATGLSLTTIVLILLGLGGAAALAFSGGGGGGGGGGVPVASPSVP